MRKPWKALAMRGDQHVYADEQVAEAATNALASDFKNEVKWSLIDALKAVFTGRDNSLGLREIALQELEEARALAAGSMFGRDTYVWESLKATTWEAGAVESFKAFTPALREYSIAGVLHFEHLAELRCSMQYELIKRRRTSELALSLEISPVSVQQNLDRFLQQHAMEWSAFTDDLGPTSFVRQWIDKAS